MVVGSEERGFETLVPVAHIEASHHVEAVLVTDLDEVVEALVILPVHVLWGVRNVYGFLLRKGLRRLFWSRIAESHYDAA